ncbi:NADPH-dependent FMN reductase [Comamonas aquatica]|jgi:chromate reductase|uniref:NADPH azoreductase n=1 Tax=Comamonas aquatica TaxID=225991 RepID=A0AA35D5F9_9BURK|nr:NADPH-dependent FMN reductase [Comamonas aquatica]CAB5663301.1 NADPH azoreductase [Comamonas aquatica]CAB5672054.1 NADPH azoreductase [Comamonas aquatica]CAC9210697.1 NADPH azoreductase [Comamonas aquatica]CAC9686466.1 NADPH azoreductase [Comamonas aquatica]
MSQYQIAVIVGSLRKASFNRQLAHALVKLAPAQVQFKEVAIGELPLYNQDADGHEVAVVKQFRDAIRSADAVLFVTPEYNRSMPGVLKNALDQGSRPYGHSVWDGKPAAVIGMSVGAIGTALAQQHLRNVLAYLNMPTLGQPEMFLQAKDGFFNADGSVGEQSRAFLQKFVELFTGWVAQHKR